jgi:SAM-dependent methyltransferase
MYICKYCECKVERASHTFREMMFGTRELFRYSECSECGSLQIRDIPEDLAPYYPDNYIPFAQNRRGGALRRTLAAKRFRYGMTGKGLTGRLLTRVFGEPYLASPLQPLELSASDAIIDVGCGNGHMLEQLHACGFTNLTGVDCYIQASHSNGSGVRFVAGDITDVQGQYRLIMYHHSFEHVISPADELRNAAERLSRHGVLMLRVPVSDSLAWREFGKDWVQLDAPRHLTIPSVAGITALAGRAGLRVDRVMHDSTAFQFWGSEQYRRDIPLNDSRSYARSPRASVFSAADIRRFTRRADELNANADGDQAVFYLQNM